MIFGGGKGKLNELIDLPLIVVPMHKLVFTLQALTIWMGSIASKIVSKISN